MTRCPTHHRQAPAAPAILPARAAARHLQGARRPGRHRGRAPDALLPVPRHAVGAVSRPQRLRVPAVRAGHPRAREATAGGRATCDRCGGRG
jgi:hypothetical protein